MSLSLHLLLHVVLALLAGILAWRIYGNLLIALISSLAAGVGVDFDHFIDYFLAFGFHLDLNYFASGYQFLKSDKIYIFFHGWEYVIIFLVAFYFVKNKKFKTIFLAAALGLLVHLTADVALNEIPFKSYSLAYRLANNFDIDKLLTKDHYQQHQELKQKTPL